MDAALDLEIAQDRLVRSLAPLGAESVDVLSSLGRFAATDITARRILPPFSNAAMDGYALAAHDVRVLPQRLPVMTTVAAGTTAPAALQPGTTARIFTGAMLPAGADAVVMQEDVERAGDTVVFSQAVLPQQHVRHAGEDMHVGQPMLRAGACVGPGDIAALAAQGICWVPVIRRPLVAIVPTGDELVEIDRPLQNGQIANSNSMMIAAQVHQAGGIAWRLPPVRDTAEALTQALCEAAAAADIILTSGGVSVGDADWLRPVLQAIGSLDFWRIAIKPGKPLAFGAVRGRPLLGLPGNPVSSFVCFEMFARPALRRLQGALTPCRTRHTLALGTALPARGARRELLRATLAQTPLGLTVSALTKQGSGQLSSLLGVDALIDCAAHALAKPVGADVDVWILRPEL